MAIRREAALNPEYAVGQRVMTIDQLPGRVLFAAASFSPGLTEYEVQLDGGLGHGTYTASQLRPLPADYRAGQRGSNLPAGVTASFEAEAAEVHTADLDYPEMGTVLDDRPDPGKLIRVMSGLRKTASSHGYDGPDDDRDEDYNGGELNDVGMYWAEPGQQRWVHDNIGPQEEAPPPLLDSPVLARLAQIEEASQFFGTPRQEAVPADRHATRHATTINGTQIDDHGDAPGHGSVPRASDPNSYDQRSTEGDGDPKWSDAPPEEKRANNGATVGMYPEGMSAGDGPSLPVGAYVAALRIGADTGPMSIEALTDHLMGAHGFNHHDIALATAGHTHDWLPHRDALANAHLLDHSHEGFRHWENHPHEMITEGRRSDGGPLNPRPSETEAMLAHSLRSRWEEDNPREDVSLLPRRDHVPEGAATYHADPHRPIDPVFGSRHVPWTGHERTELHDWDNGGSAAWGDFVNRREFTNRTPVGESLPGSVEELQAEGAYQAFPLGYYQEEPDASHGPEREDGEPEPATEPFLYEEWESTASPDEHARGAQKWKLHTLSALDPDEEAHWRAHLIRGHGWGENNARRSEARGQRFGDMHSPLHQMGMADHQHSDPRELARERSLANMFGPDAAGNPGKDKSEGWQLARPQNGGMTRDDLVPRLVTSVPAREPVHPDTYEERDPARFRRMMSALDARNALLSQLEDDYPPQATEWIRHDRVTGPHLVPLSSIDLDDRHTWSAYKQPAKVAGFGDTLEKKQANGKHLKPALVVATPRRNFIGDGHHRYLTSLLAAADGSGPPGVWAFTAEVDQASGPWDEMHGQQIREKSKDSTGTEVGPDAPPEEVSDFQDQVESAIGALGLGSAHDRDDDSLDAAPPSSPRAWPMAGTAITEGGPAMTQGRDDGRKKRSMAPLPGADANDPGAGTARKPEGPERPGQPRKQAHLDAFVVAASSPAFRFEFTASWHDVIAKAKRIRKEGRVRITHASAGMVIGAVSGDHDVYETGIQRPPHKPQTIQHWACCCPWASFHQDKSLGTRYAGRPCSHVMALQFEAQARSMFGRTIERDLGIPDHEVVVKSMPPWTPSGWAQTWLAPSASLRTATPDEARDWDLSPEEREERWPHLAVHDESYYWQLSPEDRGPAEERDEEDDADDGSDACYYGHAGDCPHPGMDRTAESLRHPRPRGFYSEITPNPKFRPGLRYGNEEELSSHVLTGYVGPRMAGKLHFSQSDDGQAFQVNMLHTYDRSPSGMPNDQHKGVGSALMDDLYSHVRQNGRWLNHGWRTTKGNNWWAQYQEPYPEVNVHHAHPEDGWHRYWPPVEVAVDAGENFKNFGGRGAHTPIQYDYKKYGNDDRDEMWTHARGITPAQRATAALIAAGEELADIIALAQLAGFCVEAEVSPSRKMMARHLQTAHGSRPETIAKWDEQPGDLEKMHDRMHQARAAMVLPHQHDEQGGTGGPLYAVESAVQREASATSAVSSMTGTGTAHCGSGSGPLSSSPENRRTGVHPHQERINDFSATGPEVRPDRSRQFLDLVATADSPAPAVLPPLVMPIDGDHRSVFGNRQASPDHILVGHAYDQFVSAPIFATVETSLSFIQAGQPCGLNGIHAVKCTCVEHNGAIRLTADQTNAPWGSENVSKRPPGKPYGATQPPDKDQDPGSYGPLAGPDPDNWGSIQDDSAIQMPLTNQASLTCRHGSHGWCGTCDHEAYIAFGDMPGFPPHLAYPDISEWQDENQDSFGYSGRSNTAGPATSIDPGDPQGLSVDAELHDDPEPALPSTTGDDIEATAAADGTIGGGGAGSGDDTQAPADVAGLGEFGAGLSGELSVRNRPAASGSVREQFRTKFGGVAMGDQARAEFPQAQEPNPITQQPGTGSFDEPLSPDNPSIQTIGQQQWSGGGSDSDEAAIEPGQPEGDIASIVAQFQRSAAARQFAGSGSSRVAASPSDGDIAAIARQYLTKTADVLPEKEAAELISEGRGQRARNLGLLRLEGTHYEDQEDDLAKRGLSLDDYDDDVLTV